MNSVERPIWELLTAVSKRLSLHMPAAQGRPPFEPMDAYRLDTTELPVTDDLYAPAGAIGRAQALAAKSAGVAHTLLLHGGSTAGIHAMLLYAAGRGEEIILPRNVHLSALNACAVAGITPVFAEPSYTVSGRPYTKTASYLRAMEKYPQAKAVLAVRPDYYGLLSDLAPLAEAARKRGMLLLCDEAHGATLNWRKDAQNAGALGADLFVQSAHKTLPALTAGAWLHASGKIDEPRLRRMLRMVQTSSPSFVSMCSLDDARAWMDEYGTKACTALAEAVEAFYQQVSGLGYACGQADAPAGFAYDPLRLVLRAPEGGYALEEALRQRGLDVEMCDAGHIVCILSLMDGQERLETLAQTLQEIKAVQEQAPKKKRLQAPLIFLPQAPPEDGLPLWEAAFAPCETVPMEKAGGRISAAHVGLYPPGVALCAAGERFSKELIDFLTQTPPERIFGLPCAGGLSCVTIEHASMCKQRSQTL